ncbi:MAG: hypothetical protein EDM74_12170 [Armatimonadetes bacterium]|nr:MAG: hypothetical protein EDM74_12170 [Armatimonadota bacterium]
MRAWIARALGLVGCLVMLAGIWSVVTGRAGVIPASPEVDSGPPARIFGALTALVGAALGGVAIFAGKKSSRRV